MSLDPIDFAVIRNGLIAVARDVATAFRRTAMLPVLYEGQDYGISLLDSRFNVIADGPGIPIFVGSLDSCARSSVEASGGEESLCPGDILLNSDPYLTAGQPVDAALIAPIFWKNAIIGYAALRGHMGDFGAMNTYPTNSTELVQEGVILPGVKLFRQGELDDGVVRIVRANSRLPHETVGSILAGAAALAIGQRKMRAVVETWGIDRYQASIAELLDHGERTARKAIARIPDGIYVAEDFLDDNGVTDEPVKIRCSVTVRGSDMNIDLAGSSPQQGGPINCPWPYTLTTCRFALKQLASPDLPGNSGEARPLTITAPEGTVFTPARPAPCFLSFLSSLRLADLIIDALGPALPNQIPAGNGGDIIIALAFLREAVTSKVGLMVELGAIGFGGRNGRDGMSALLHPIQASGQNFSAEATEARLPVLKRSYELIPDSGGAGQFRGGLGVRSEFEFLGEGVLTVVAEKTRASEIRAIGGGKPPTQKNVVRVFPRTERERRLGKASDIPVRPGDMFEVRAAGGGGWGDPLDRDLEKVSNDVANGYVSYERASSDYGVVFDKTNGSIDERATAKLRARLIDAVQKVADLA